MSGFHNQNLLTFQVRHGKTEYLLRSFVFGCLFQDKNEKRIKTNRNIRQKDGRHMLTVTRSFVYITVSSVLRLDSLLMKIVNSTI